MDKRLQRGESSRERRIPEEMMVARLMPEGQCPEVMYDLGVGCFYEFRTLKVVWPHLRLFGCEPCPDAYEELRPMFGGSLICKAIGAECGVADLYLTHKDQAGSTLKPAESEMGRDVVQVEVWTLDKFDEWAGKRDKILLWMDIEGSEMDALHGGQELLASGRVGWLNVETRDACGDCLRGHPTTAEVTAFLRQFGYVPVHRYNVQGNYPEAAGDVLYFKEGSRPKLSNAINWGVYKH